MRKIMIALLLLSGITACKGQSEKNKPATLKIGHNKPGASWKVNKKYDEKGNLISYDSTYVWSYSSKNGKTQNVNADSVLMEFRNNFSMDIPSFFRDEADFLGWNDSSFYRDFATPDYFMKHWQEQTAEMNRMMIRMDSLRNNFLRNNYPNINTQPKGDVLRQKTL